MFCLFKTMYYLKATQNCLQLSNKSLNVSTMSNKHEFHESFYDYHSFHLLDVGNVCDLRRLHNTFSLTSCIVNSAFKHSTCRDTKQTPMFITKLIPFSIIT